MSFNNSILTFQQLKDEVEFERSESLQDGDVIRALNKALSIYQRIERAAYPQRYKRVVENTPITSAGFDLLTNITDLGSDEEGFRVYRGDIRRDNLLTETEFGSRKRGYFIQEGKLFITPSSSDAQNTSITYVQATTRFPLTQALNTILPIDQDVEWAFEEFVLSRFYNRSNQDDLRDEAQERYIDELERYFAKPFRTVTLSGV